MLVRPDHTWHASGDYVGYHCALWERHTLDRACLNHGYVYGENVQDFARPDKVWENHDNDHGKIESFTSYDKHGVNEMRRQLGNLMVGGRIVSSTLS
jgi:hypothetical protein